MDRAEQILKSIDFNSGDKNYYLRKLNLFNDELIRIGYNDGYSKAYLNNEEGRKKIVDEYIEDCFWLDDKAIEDIKSNPNLLFELKGDDAFDNCNADDDYIQYSPQEGIITMNMEDVKVYLKDELENF